MLARRGRALSHGNSSSSRSRFSHIVYVDVVGGQLAQGEVPAVGLCHLEHRCRNRLGHDHLPGVSCPEHIHKGMCLVHHCLWAIEGS
jgi:hypothetical protein